MTQEEYRLKHREYQRQWRLKNPERARAYDQAYRWEHRATVAARRVQRRKENAEHIQAEKSRWKREHPGAVRAQNRLNWAIYQGRITKPDTCSRCGAGGRIHGHHADYNRPFDVEWLCHWCHTAVHHPDSRLARELDHA